MSAGITMKQQDLPIQGMQMNLIWLCHEQVERPNGGGHE